MINDLTRAPSLVGKRRSHILTKTILLVAVVTLAASCGSGSATPDDEPTVTEEPRRDDETSSDEEPSRDDGASSDEEPEDAGTQDEPSGSDPADDPPDEPRYPGTGSDAALDNPNCDPNTGRIRFPGSSAPPCVVEWPENADNGGSTAMGVTEDAIVMLVRVDPGQTEIIEDVAVIPKAWRDIGEIYNEHYEFWGRELRFEFIESSGTDEVSQRADATRAVNDFQPFLAHDATTDGTGRGVFEAEMAARGVIVWGANASWQETQDQPGFRWSGTADDRVTMLHVAEYVGKRVAGRSVQWAGDDDLNGQPRRIGIIYTDRWDREFIDEQAAANGFEIVEAVSYDVLASDAQRQERAQIIAARMKDADVTTVIAGTDNLFTGTMTRAATDQQWFPEWVITGYSGQDAPFFARTYDQAQWANAFGPGPIGVQVANQPTGYRVLVEWHHGRDEVNLSMALANSVLDWPASCLQLAGPNLTPESYQQGCFAIPPTGGSYCGCVASVGAAFGDGRLPWTDYTAFDDMTEKWWDPTYERVSDSGFTRLGAYLYVDGGRRYAVGEWTDDDPNVFDPQGAIERYEDPPPNDVLPEYEYIPR